MSTELVKKAQNTSLAALLEIDLEAAAASSARDFDINTAGYIKFSGKTGEYTFNGGPMEKGTQVVFDMATLKKGRMCFVDNGVADRIEVSAYSGETLPAVHELTDHGPYKDGEGWKDSYSFDVIMPDTGERVRFGLMSKGGVNEMYRFFKKWAVEVRLNVDAGGSPLYPLVELDSEEIPLKTSVGSYHVPRFTIAEWISADELAGEAEGEEVEAAPAPPPPKAKAPARAAAAAPKRGFGSGVRGARV